MNVFIKETHIILHFVTNGNYRPIIGKDDKNKPIFGPEKQNVAVLGTLSKVHKDDIKRYVKMFPIHWISA